MAYQPLSKKNRDFYEELICPAKLSTTFIPNWLFAALHLATNLAMCHLTAKLAEYYLVYKQAVAKQEHNDSIAME